MSTANIDIGGGIYTRLFVIGVTVTRMDEDSYLLRKRDIGRLSGLLLTGAQFEEIRNYSIEVYTSGRATAQLLNNIHSNAIAVYSFGKDNARESDGARHLVVKLSRKLTKERKTDERMQRIWTDKELAKYMLLYSDGIYVINREVAK